MQVEDSQAKRHRLLKKLIGEASFSSQSALVARMRKFGLHATQSSISRDLRELGVMKIAGKYALPIALERKPQNTIQRMILEIDFAGQNLVVVKTTPGAANAVAQAIDEEKPSGIVGTVAGDDTIFIAVKNRTSQRKIAEAVKRIS